MRLKKKVKCNILVLEVQGTINLKVRSKNLGSRKTTRRKGWVIYLYRVGEWETWVFYILQKHHWIGPKVEEQPASWHPDQFVMPRLGSKTPDWSMIGSYELNLRIFCLWALASVIVLRFNSAVWRYREGWGYKWVKNLAGWKKENLRRDQRDNLAKPSFDREPEAQGGNRLAFSFTATWWHIRNHDVLHTSHHCWDVRYVVCVVMFSCLPGLWQSFPHHPSNRLISWTCLWWHYWLSMRSIMLTASHRLCVPS